MKRSNRSPLWRLPADLEVREEMETHLELMVRDLVREGLDEAEARRRAAARFGDAEGYARECRGLARRRNRRWSGSALLGELHQDLQAGARQIRRHAAVSLTIVAMLALGLGSLATSLDLVFGSILRPPPFAEPERLLTLWEHQTVRDHQKNVVSPANFLAWKEGTDAFDGMAAFITITFNLTDASEGGREPQRVKVRGVTDGYFDLLGITPLAGEDLGPRDVVEGAERVVLLSHRLWSQRFGGRTDVVGESVVLDGESYRVKGVLPADAALDMGPGLSPYGDAADLYFPMATPDAWRTPRGRWLQVVARLADGETALTAQQQLDAVMQRQLEQHPRFNADWRAQVVPLGEHLQEPLKLPVLALAGGAFLVLLIACFNASSLLLGRVLARRDELEVRAALGAGRSRILRQLAVEGAVLAGAAGALAWLLSGLFGQIARAALPIAPPSAGGGPMLLLALTVLCALLFALPGLPAVGRLHRGRAPGSGARSLGGSRQRLRSALVFAQVALTLVLLVGAGLMLRTVWRLLDVDPGFARDGIVSFSLSPARGSEAAAVDAFYDQLLERLDELGGVENAGAVSHLPMASAGAATSYWPSDRPQPEAGQADVADIRIVRGEYFDALGIPLLEGRLFDGSERAEHKPGSIVVSESVAARFWPEESAIDRELMISWGDDDARRVVGVVADVRHAALGTPPRDAIYFPASQEPQNGMTVVLETARDPEALVAPLRGLIHQLDPSLPLYDMQTVSGVLDRSISHQKLLAWSLLAFAALAILLAAVGIYGLTALAVSQSTREIGLRMALGASPGGVALRFLGRIARLTLAALLAGLACALLLGRSLEALLVDIETWDPATLVVTALLLGLVALFAAAMPVRRAARLDPTRALRWE